MTQIEHEPTGVEEPGPPAPRASSPYRAAVLALAAVLLLVVALVATAPLWAPLLPWGAATPAAETALAARLQELAAAQQQSRQQGKDAAAAVAAAVQRLDRRIAALEARPLPPTADIAELREQMARLSTAATDLAAHVAAVDKVVRARASGGATDTGLALLLLQIRNSVAAGRPFAAEYEALAALAHDRPEIAAAAAPLAEPAKSGVASRAVLAQGLRELSRTIASTRATTPAAPGLTAAMLARLRGLVTIRRIDGAAPGGTPDAASAAELALAGGDLAGAVAALDKSTGAASTAAGPWLRMARQLLAVEAALQRVETLLTARLGNAAPGSGG